jgi:hypothetical protein
MRISFFALFSSFLVLPLFAQAQEGIHDGLEMDSLLAKVGREAVLYSDLQRFADVDKVLSCAGVVVREKPLPAERKPLLEAYIDEELMYQEARAKKIGTAGSIPETVQLIHEKAVCRNRWQKLGDRYSKFWRTETRAREGESLLVRELEKRVLIERFRRGKTITDFDLWKREVKVRFPVKIYIE